jgi:PAP2 superfamily
MRKITTVFIATQLACVLVGCTAGTAEPAAPTFIATSTIDVATDRANAVSTLEAVLRWNALSSSLAPTLAPPGLLLPWTESRLSAITNVAMHDALNGVRTRYSRYADQGDAYRDANATAAVISAGFNATIGATSAAALAPATAAYNADIAALRAAHASGIDDGIALGKRAAAAVLARRVGDGVDHADGPYVPGHTPGDYRFTAPFNAPPFDLFGTGGVFFGNLLGHARPFVIRSGSQFRAPRPYGAADNAAAVRTEAYTKDFREVLALGCDTCATRTAEQTEIAKFWIESSPAAWNRVARSVAGNAHFDAWETARLLALVQLAEFDSYVASLESKNHYSFWRPVTAVELAATDGNPATTTQAGWQALGAPTPPIPDYPSGHSSAGGAAAAVIELLVPRKHQEVTLTSTTLTGVTRHFANVRVAARENANSRVFVGYHFRRATQVGLLQGTLLGAYIATHTLRAR